MKRTHICFCEKENIYQESGESSEDGMLMVRNHSRINTTDWPVPLILWVNSNPQKLCAIINVYCCSKLLNLGLIYYAAIDNIINLITQVHKENFLETFTITIKENDNH